MTPDADQWLATFRRYLTTERRYSPHTDTNYTRDLLALAAFCDKEGLKEWREVTHQHVRTFAMRMHASGLGARSLRRRLSAVRSFFGFLLSESLNARQQGARRKEDGPPLPSPDVLSNPALDITTPKLQKTLPRTVDADRMAKLLDMPAGTGLVARDHAIMELFYSSGLRLAELCALDVQDLDLAGERTVRVEKGKGGKGRIVPVGSKAVEALKIWLRERAAMAKSGEQALFVARAGTRMGFRAVQKRVTYWARKQGLDVHIHPHLFRHSFATHILESSQDIRGVQELLGHADVRTTQIYTHLDFQHLARIYEAAHPRARKKA